MFVCSTTGLAIQRRMSPLPPKADMDRCDRKCPLCANRVLTRRKKVSLFYDLVGDGKQCLRHGEAEYPSGLSVYDEFEPA
jgi:hypothetical protein